MLLFNVKMYVIFFAAIFSAVVSASTDIKLTEAYFSPRQGKEVFKRMNKEISEAKKSVHISIYSWSDSKIKDSLVKAAQNGAAVRVLLMKKLYDTKERVRKYSEEIELAGGEVKIAGHGGKVTGGAMHEKIIIIDNKIIVNSSANMSSGPKTKYAENWIFHYNTIHTQTIFDDFNHEFTILWNSGYDVVTNNEENAEALDLYRPGSRSEQLLNLPNYDTDAVLVSMSHNHKLKEINKSSDLYKTGRSIKLVSRKVSRKRTWLIRDKVIDKINKAEQNISCAFNHLFIEEIALALVDAAKRGVDVRLAVDNQEFKHGKTKVFVKEWKKLAGNSNKEVPVRLRFYSLSPSPSYWFLNHHKYCVIDYGTDKVNLINGSYNFSQTAEHKQFDNQVFYKSEKFYNLYDSFQEDFEILWNENRGQDDTPDTEYMEYFKRKNRYGALPLHNYEKAVSLKWSELKKLHYELEKLAPGVTRTGIRKRDCKFYKFIKREGRQIVNKYYGCPQQR